MTVPQHAAAPRRPLRITLAAVAAAALAAAAVAVTAGSTPGRHPGAAPTCARQYQAWKHGPALTPAHAAEAALRQAAASGALPDIRTLRAALSRLGPAERSLSRYPIPRCADPAGYWARVLALLRAASDDAGAAKSVTLALVPLSEIPPVSRKLAAELHRTTGR